MTTYLDYEITEEQIITDLPVQYVVNLDGAVYARESLEELKEIIRKWVFAN